jgi:hypothetical protein
VPRAVLAAEDAAGHNREVTEEAASPRWEPAGPPKEADQLDEAADRGPWAVSGTRREKFLPTWDYQKIIPGRSSCDVLLSKNVTGGPPGVLTHTRWGDPFPDQISFPNIPDQIDFVLKLPFHSEKFFILLSQTKCFSLFTFLG